MRGPSKQHLEVTLQFPSYAACRSSEYCAISDSFSEVPEGEDEYKENSVNAEGIAYKVCKKDINETVVKRHGLIHTSYLRVSDNCVDRALELNFAKSQYSHFRGAFAKTSFFMMCGVFALASNAVIFLHWARAGILFGVVAPIYTACGILASCSHHDKFLAMSQGMGERLLICTFCFQSLAIVFAEWVRPELDYGLLAVHISYMNNFTPLPSITAQLVTAFFGLLPYCLAKIMRFSIPSWNFMDWSHLEVKVGSREVEVICTQADHSGIEQVVTSIVVPFILFLYLVLVTCRRDESMRWDSLFKHNLARQQRMLADEQCRNEGILESMLPKQIIRSLKASENIEPQEFRDVTVIFVEICQFAQLCCNLSPANVVEVLNIIYHEFDRLSDLLHVYKVETVAQVYMAVVGAPDSITNHADVAAHFGLALSHTMEIMRPRLNSIIMANKVVSPRSPQSSTQTSVPGMCNGVGEPPQPRSSGSNVSTCVDDLTIEIRTGINSGQLFAGVVGIDSPRYKLFGDTVNTASRMESTCEPGCIQVSPSTMPKLTKGMFALQDRGLINVKGKGNMNTYYLTGYATAGSYSTRRIVIDRMMVTHLASIGNSTASATRLPSGSDVMIAMNSSWTSRNGYADNLTRECVPPLTCGRDGTELTRDTSGHSHLATSSQSGSRQNYYLSDALDMSRKESADTETGLEQLGQILKDIGGELWTENSGNRENAKLSWWERVMYFFLLVPASQKKPQWIAQLRADMPLYLEYTHEKRLVFARQLTILMLVMLSILWAIVDLLETEISANPTYANVMVARDWGHTFVGLLYLFTVSITAWSPRIEQMLTMTMLLVQGGTLLMTGTVLWDSEMSFVACLVMYGVYVLFFTVCSISQRLLVCSLAIVSYILMKSMTCSRHISTAPIIALQNVGFLIFFIGSIHCSLWLQEHLSHVFHYDRRADHICIEKTEQARTGGSQLLTNLLPPHIVSLVCNGTSPIAETHDGVTILFTDIKGFTKFSASVSPQKLCSVLNSMYSAFDEIIYMWELYKVEIIGDAYWVSAGCPPRLFNQDGAQDDEGASRNHNYKQKEHEQERRETTESEFAMRAVEVGLAMLRALPSVCDDNNVQMRVGIHTGSVVAGVVGKKGPRYHLFGTTVAYAEQMERTGIPGRVQISDVTHTILERGSFAYDHEERAVEIDDEAVAPWDDPPACTWLVNKSNNREAIQIQQKFMEARRRQSNQNYADDKP